MQQNRRKNRGVSTDGLDQSDHRSITLASVSVVIPLTQCRRCPEQIVEDRAERPDLGAANPRRGP